MVRIVNGEIVNDDDPDQKSSSSKSQGGLVDVVTNFFWNIFSVFFMLKNIFKILMPKC